MLLLSTKSFLPLFHPSAFVFFKCTFSSFLLLHSTAPISFFSSFSPFFSTLHHPVSLILIILYLFISEYTASNSIFNLFNPFMNLLMYKLQEEGGTKYKYKIYQYKSIQFIANFSFPALEINKCIIGKQFFIHLPLDVFKAISNHLLVIKMQNY